MHLNGLWLTLVLTLLLLNEVSSMRSVDLSETGSYANSVAPTQRPKRPPSPNITDSSTTGNASVELPRRTEAPKAPPTTPAPSTEPPTTKPPKATRTPRNTDHDYSAASGSKELSTVKKPKESTRPSAASTQDDSPSISTASMGSAWYMELSESGSDDETRRPETDSPKTDSPEWTTSSPTTQQEYTQAPDTKHSSASAASVLTNSAKGNTGLSSTLVLYIGIGGAVAFVAIVIAVVYRKARKDEDEDEDIDALESVSRNGGRAGAQVSTVAGTYQHNPNMTPESVEDDYYHHNPQFDQEPYGNFSSRQTDMSAIDTNDPTFDVLTPQSQITVARSGMSVPQLNQSSNSNSSSEYSFASSHSSFYDHNSASQIIAKYTGMRHDVEENDVVGSDDESDGDSVHDMSHMSEYSERETDLEDCDSQISLESDYNDIDDSLNESHTIDTNKHFDESNFSEYRLSSGTYDRNSDDSDTSFTATTNNFNSTSLDNRSYKSFRSSDLSEY